MSTTCRLTSRLPRTGLPALSALTLLALATVAGCGQARSSRGDPTPECQRCHGGTSGNAAPPLGAAGQTATTDVGVGAHQAHLGRSTFAAAVTCAECHLVPTDSAAHLDGAATVTFSGRAVVGQGAGVATWNRASATCSNVACHGGAAPTWNAAGQPHLDCGGCHSSPPASHGPGATACHLCHPGTVKDDGTIDVAGGLHLDGQVELGPSQPCAGCHAAPPASGAHLVHATPPSAADLVYGGQALAEDVDPSGATGRYYFGCGACHPADPARHQNGTLEVELSPTATGLRARNAATAAFAGGTCSGVYCHSTGQAAPAFATTPAWVGGGAPGCGGCHGNPPSYANGGPTSGAANSHIFLNWTGAEGGHFAPLPGTFHRSRHGGPSSFATDERAAPMTCQACHAETVDPANLAPGGAFYLDTSLTTRLAGGDPARFGQANWLDTQCTSCHDGAPGSPPQGQGRVLPLRHVNGVRDVTFDGRTAVPAGYFSDLGAAAPTRLYFTTRAQFPVALDLTGLGLSPATWSAFAPGTLSLELSQAGYAPATQTCSSVACHLGRPATWGQRGFETNPPSCTGCHDLP
ncbi:MAG: CxxxxCH/CxxCH domain-containing protein [Anaeromyxobacter sp.]|nr:CxxxxCH/CxxCH domain-containing protein [Anaeromyxobacter sp.]